MSTVDEDVSRALSAWMKHPDEAREAVMESLAEVVEAAIAVIPSTVDATITAEMARDFSRLAIALARFAEKGFAEGLIEEALTPPLH